MIANKNIVNIGIVGQGFVGTALREGMKRHFNIRTFDIADTDERTIGKSHKIMSSLESLVCQTDVIFLCLPTPMKNDGSCDISIIENIVFQIDKISKNDDEKIVVIKSTIPPGTTNHLNSQCQNIDVVFNPEFLTEANAIEDFKNQNRIIVGGPRPASTKVRSIYQKAFPGAFIIKTGSDVAETVKYFINSFLTTKVAFSNEIKLLCDKINVDYDKVVEYALYDDRLGHSHWSVPGPDGFHGFGGHCFPKDLRAITFLMNSLGVDSTVLEAVWDKNERIREKEGRDWEKMFGRAISREK